MLGKTGIGLQRRRILGALVLPLVLLACGADEELQQQYQLEKMFFGARKAAEAIFINPRVAPTKSFDEAIALYRRIIAKADSGAANAGTIVLLKLSLVQMAELEMLQQRVDKAVEIYQEILKRFYTDDDEVTVAARLALGLLHERSLQYQDAIDAYAGLLPNFSSRIEPTNPNSYLLSIPFQFAHLNKLSRYETQSEEAYGQATEIYREIIGKWPETKSAVIATNYFAALLADQERWHELAALLEQKSTNQADTAHLAEYMHLKGLLLHHRLNRSAEATQVFQDFLEKFPGHGLAPHARFEIAKITMAQNNFEEARELFKALVKEYRNVPEVAARAREELARSFEAEGDWDAAVNEYRFLAKEFETTPPGLAAMFYIANYYTERQETKLAETAYNEAIVFYQEIIRKYPQSLVAGIAQEQIAYCFLTQKKWDEAVTAASNIEKILDNNVGRISTYLLLGSIYESTGQSKLAIKAYQEFIDQFPQHPLAGALKEKVQKLMSS